MSDYKDFGWNEERPLSYDYIYPILLKILKPSATILDIGCGNGVIANSLIDAGYNVFGIDASISGIEIANKSHPDHFFINDISSYELPLEIRNINFNQIISTEVIEHLYDPNKYIDMCKKIIKKNGGELIISTPYHGYFKNLLLAITGKMDIHFNVLSDGGHIKFWSVKTLSQLLVDNGFRLKNFYGSGRLPYLWKSMILVAEILDK